MSRSEFSKIFHLAQKQDTAEAAKSWHYKMQAGLLPLSWAVSFVKFETQQSK